MLRFIRKHFLGDSGTPIPLDFLPLNTTAKPIDTPTVEKPKALPSEPPDWEAKREEARKKLGKPFISSETKVGRMTEPSRDLEYIQDQNAIAKRASTVTNINERHRKP